MWPSDWRLHAHTVLLIPTHTHTHTLQSCAIYMDTKCKKIRRMDTSSLKLLNGSTPFLLYPCQLLALTSLLNTPCSVHTPPPHLHTPKVLCHCCCPHCKPSVAGDKMPGSFCCCFYGPFTFLTYSRKAWRTTLVCTPPRRSREKTHSFSVCGSQCSSSALNPPEMYCCAPSESGGSTHTMPWASADSL